MWARRERREGGWGGGEEGGKEVRYGLRLIKYKPGWGVPKQAQQLRPISSLRGQSFAS